MSAEIDAAVLECATEMAAKAADEADEEVKRTAAAVEQFDAELQTVREDVKHLKVGLTSVIKRVDRLEVARATLAPKRFNISAVVGSHDAGGGTSEQMDTDGPLLDGEALNHVGKKQTSVSRTQRMIKTTSYHRAFGTPAGDVTQGLSYLEEAFPECYRIIGVRRSKGSGDTMGLSLVENNGVFSISEIADDSLISTLGLLHVGDTVLSINEKRISSLQQAVEELVSYSEGFQIKVVPAQPNQAPVSLMYLKAYWDYSPHDDKLIPLKLIGLPFRSGDVLQVISKDDENWWLARKMFDSSQIGIIPSQALQASRVVTKVISPPHGKSTLKKGNKEKEANGYIPGRGGDKGLVHEPLVYEEVGRLCPYGRKVLVLLGAPGVGRRTLKSRLLRHDPLHFATVVPYTSRAKRDGEQEGREYHFVPKEKIKKEIDNGEFLEWGEFGGNFYGTKLQSVKDVIKTGRMCVLDCSPQAIKHLYFWEFMPYVVFISPPPLDELKALYSTQITNQFRPKTEAELEATTEYNAKLDASFRQYFDLILTNRNAEVTFRRLLDSLETLKTQQQWVPINWLYTS